MFACCTDVSLGGVGDAGGMSGVQHGTCLPYDAAQEEAAGMTAEQVELAASLPDPDMQHDYADALADIAEVLGLQVDSLRHGPVVVRQATDEVLAAAKQHGTEVLPGVYRIVTA